MYLVEKQTNTNFIFNGLTQPGLEPKIYKNFRQTSKYLHLGCGWILMYLVSAIYCIYLNISWWLGSTVLHVHCDIFYHFN